MLSDDDDDDDDYGWLVGESRKYKVGKNYKGSFHAPVYFDVDEIFFTPVPLTLLAQQKSDKFTNILFLVDFMSSTNRDIKIEQRYLLPPSISTSASGMPTCLPAHCT